MMNTIHDVAEIRLGAWGSAATHHLARRGKRVVGVDRYHPPHRMGSSHGQGCVIRLASPESPLYTPLHQRAYELWDILAKESSRELIPNVGKRPAVTDNPAIVGYSLARSHGPDLKQSSLRGAETRQRLPEFTLSGDEYHCRRGRCPSDPARMATAPGGSGRGYNMASMIGEALADLVDGSERPDLAFLSASRFHGEG